MHVPCEQVPWYEQLFGQPTRWLTFGVSRGAEQSSSPHPGMHRHRPSSQMPWLEHWGCPGHLALIEHEGPSQPGSQ
eukprot:1310809-Amorphochlora_amoeboformis.AAC.1